PRGWIAVDGRRIPLETISAIYLRPEPQPDARPAPASACLLAIAAFLDAVVVNRPAVGRSNLTQQLQLRASGAPHRRASRPVSDRTIVATDIDGVLGERLVALTRHMGLLVAGIDLRVTADDEWFCFEGNPSPGLTFYQDATRPR